MFVELKAFSEAGEKNWWTGVESCLVKYNLPRDLNVVKSMTKEAFSDAVKKAVTEVALNCLKAECAGLRKTASLKYESLKLQDYLSALYPSQAKVIFKWRSQTLDIKSHLSYKYDDRTCRGCGIEEEVPYHIMNCGFEDKINVLDVLSLDEIDDFTKSELKRMIIRLKAFQDRVETKAEDIEGPAKSNV